MNERMIGLCEMAIRNSAPTSTREQIASFTSMVEETLKSAKPGRKGWKERLPGKLLPAFLKAEAERVRKAASIRRAEWLASEEYAALAAKERKYEKKHELPLAVGESLLFRGNTCWRQVDGSMGPTGQERAYAHHCTDKGKWMGISGYSHAELSDYDFFFLPDSWEVKVEVKDRGCPISFFVAKITRIA